MMSGIRNRTVDGLGLILFQLSITITYLQFFLCIKPQPNTFVYAKSFTAITLKHMLLKISLLQKKLSVKIIYNILLNMFVNPCNDEVISNLLWIFETHIIIENVIFLVYDFFYYFHKITVRLIQ